MNKVLINIIIFFFLFINQSNSEENIMILKLKDGDVKIELFEDVAPNHVKRIKRVTSRRMCLRLPHENDSKVVYRINGGQKL